MAEARHRRLDLGGTRRAPPGAARRCRPVRRASGRAGRWPPRPSGARAPSPSGGPSRRRRSSTNDPSRRGIGSLVRPAGGAPLALELAEPPAPVGAAGQPGEPGDALPPRRRDRLPVGAARRDVGEHVEQVRPPQPAPVDVQHVQHDPRREPLVQGHARPAVPRDARRVEVLGEQPGVGVGGRPHHGDALQRDAVGRGGDDAPEHLAHLLVGVAGVDHLDDPGRRAGRRPADDADVGAQRPARRAAPARLAATGAGRWTTTGAGWTGRWSTAAASRSASSYQRSASSAAITRCRRTTSPARREPCPTRWSSTAGGTWRSSRCTSRRAVTVAWWLATGANIPGRAGERVAHGDVDDRGVHRAPTNPDQGRRTEQLGQAIDRDELGCGDPAVGRQPAPGRDAHRVRRHDDRDGSERVAGLQLVDRGAQRGERRWPVVDDLRAGAHDGDSTEGVRDGSGTVPVRRARWRRSPA